MATVDDKIVEIDRKTYVSFRTRPTATRRSSALIKDMLDLYKLCEKDDDFPKVRDFAHKLDQDIGRRGCTLHDAILVRLREALREKRKSYIQDYLERNWTNGEALDDQQWDSLIQLRDESLRFQKFANNTDEDNVIMRNLNLTRLLSLLLNQTDNYIWEEMKQKKLYTYFFTDEKISKAYDKKWECTLKELKELEYIEKPTPANIKKSWRIIANAADSPALHSLFEGDAGIDLSNRLVSCLQSEIDKMSTPVKDEVKDEEPIV